MSHEDETPKVITKLNVELGVYSNYYIFREDISKNSDKSITSSRTLYMNIENVGHVVVIKNLSEIIKFNATLKGFASNKLVSKKVYETPYFTAVTVSRNNEVNLHIHFKNKNAPDEYFDKLEASILSDQLSKTISQVKY